MGAFLLRYWRSRVRFTYNLFFLARGTLAVPGWIFLPIWFIEQIYFASLTPAEAGGVAYAAHAAGFGFGLIAALVHQATGFEKRYVAPAIESRPRIVTPAKPRVPPSSGRKRPRAPASARAPCAS
jgi:membrane associated rhomboid family serine protease